MYKNVFIFILLQTANSKLQYIKEPETVKPLLNYLLNEIKSIKQEDRYPTLSLRNTIGNKCREVIDKVLLKLYDPPLIIWNTAKTWNLKNTQSQGSYIFLNNLEDLNDTLFEMKTNKFIYSNDGSFFFIVCERTRNYDLVKNSLEIVWKYRLIDFALIYYMNRLEMVEYNPFTKEILNMSDCNGNSCQTIDKLNNLHGYKLKIFAVDDFPSNRLINGRFYGRDGKLLRGLLQKINATYEFYSPKKPNLTDYDLQMEALTKNLVDFSGLGGVMHFNKPWNISFTYPHEMDDIILIIPINESKHFNNFLLVFDMYTWICLILSMVLTSFIMDICKIYLRLPYNTFDSLFELVRLSLTECTILFNKRSECIRLLLISWIILCVIFDAAVQSAIIKISIINKPQRFITSLNEIENVEMKIFISYRHSKLYPPEFPLSKQFSPMLRHDLYKSILNGVKTGAHALPRSYAIDILKFIDESNVKKTYYILNEGIIPSLYVYAFPIKSPYLNKVDNFITSDREFGFGKHYSPEEDEAVSRSFENKTKLQPFNLNHMQFLFYVLFIGYIFSIITFVAEKFYYTHFVQPKYMFVL